MVVVVVGGGGERNKVVVFVGDGSVMVIGGGPVQGELGEYMRHFLEKKDGLVRVTMTVVRTVMNLVEMEV